MVAVQVRATGPLAVAPSTPGAWWPGARMLPESVMRRIPRAMGRIAIPVTDGRAATVPAPAEPEPMAMTAPWGEPTSPFAGVTVSTRQVPLSWLRPERPMGRGVPVPVVAGPLAASGATARPATITELPRAPRTVPQLPATGPRGPIGRFRRAAALAVGLLVSLVAVEAAARSGRR